MSLHSIADVGQHTEDGRLVLLKVVCVRQAVGAGRHVRFDRSRKGGRACTHRREPGRSLDGGGMLRTRGQQGKPEPFWC